MMTESLDVDFSIAHVPAFFQSSARTSQSRVPRWVEFVQCSNAPSAPLQSSFLHTWINTTYGTINTKAVNPFRWSFYDSQCGISEVVRNWEAQEQRTGFGHLVTAQYHGRLTFTASVSREVDFHCLVCRFILSIHGWRPVPDLWSLVRSLTTNRSILFSGRLCVVLFSDNIFISAGAGLIGEKPVGR